jgi:putative intracellular protease/amidase
MRRLYFFITDTLADWEAGHVLAELRSGRYLKDPALRYDVVLCGRTMKTVTTMGGIRMYPEIRIRDIQPDTGDLLVLPGADTWLDPAQERVIVKARELLENDVTVAAICGATLALADAGMLDGFRHTSNDLTALKMFCPHYKGEKNYVNEPAVTDGNLITASGLAPVEFAYHVFAHLDVMSPTTLKAWYGLFTEHTPEYYFALMDSLNASCRRDA